VNRYQRVSGTAGIGVNGYIDGIFVDKGVGFHANEGHRPQSGLAPDPPGARGAWLRLRQGGKPAPGRPQASWQRAAMDEEVIESGAHPRHARPSTLRAARAGTDNADLHLEGQFSAQKMQRTGQPQGPPWTFAQQGDRPESQRGFRPGNSQGAASL